MKFTPLPSADFLRSILQYNAEAGILLWKNRPSDFWPNRPGESVRWNGRYAGKPALHAIHSGGYRGGKINGVAYQAHRICWKIHTGNDPYEILDHVNGIRTDNRFINLREATFEQNVGNRASNKDTSSKYRGASWCSRDRFWASYCGGVSLGRFNTEEDAARAYNEYAVKHYGGFAKLNQLES